MRTTSGTQRHSGAQRRGTAYILVLGVGTLVMLIALTALGTARNRQAINRGHTNLAEARTAARAGIEIVLQDVLTDADWRTAHGTETGTQNWIDDLRLDDSRVWVDASDPGDSWIASGLCDELMLTVMALDDDARQFLRVRLQPDALDFADPLPEVTAALGAVAYWRLGETTGTVAEDVLGDYDGVYRHGVTLGADGPYRCDTLAEFDGHNDFVEVPHDDVFLIDEGAVSVWFMLATSYGYHGLVSKDSAMFDTGGHFTLRQVGDQLELRLQSDDHSYYLYSPELATARWYHAVVTFGEAGLKLYLDGALVDDHWYEGGLGPSSGGAGNYEPWAIGVNTARTDDQSTNGWDEPFEGFLDEVAVFGHQLDANEVATLHAVGASPPPHTLKIIEGSWERLTN